MLLRGERWHVHSLIVEMGYVDKVSADGKAQLTDDLLAPLQAPCSFLRRLDECRSIES